MTGHGSILDASALDSDRTIEADVVIVGSGAGGGVSAEILSAAGLRVVILEEGAAIDTRENPTLREIPAFARLYRDGGMSPTHDGGVAVVQGRVVGGSTVVNWTSCFRTPEPTLRHWRDVHGIEGLAAEDLAPWFESMERRLGVVTWEHPNPNNDLLARGAARLGWTFGSIRRNVRGCANLGYCGLGCPRGAKQGMDRTTIPAAVGDGALLATRLRAERIEWRAQRAVAIEAIALDPSGRDPTGRRVRIEARFVVVAAGAIQSPALLLRSKLPDPHARLGKRTFLQIHNYSMASMPERVDPFYGAPQSVYTNQFTWRDGVSGRAGFNMEAAGAQPVVSMNLVRAVGERLADLARRLPHRHTLVSQIRDGFSDASPGGEVRLRDDASAVLEYPLDAFVWDGVRASYLAMAECQFAAGAETVLPATSDAPVYRSWGEAKRGIGSLELRSPNVVLHSTHPLGGCAMGADPRNSVVDSFGRHHGIENLFVIDGSVFPTSLGVNPSLSIYALAARNATALTDRILGRARRATPGAFRATI
jgi:choline dehydrogenase-like flavoprotein